jgi:hypothetical protein
MQWSDDEHQAIRQIAYAIWKKDGRPHWSRAIKDSKQNWSMLFPKYDPHH